MIPTGSDITEYLVATVANVKHSKNIQQSIRVAMFEGYETVNMVELAGDYYWLVSYAEIANGEVRYVLDFAAPTTMLAYDDAIKGIWSKTPTRRCAYMHETIANDTMTVDSTTQIRTDREDKTYWVQVCGNDSNGHPQYRGFFAYVRDEDVMAPNSAIGRYIKTATSPYYQLMPPLQLVIKDPAEYIGILAEDITDFSVSAVCPYQYSIDTISTTIKAYNINTSAVVQVSTSGTGYYAWDLSQLSNVKDAQTLRIDISDEKTNSLGSAVIRDSSGNAIMSLNMQAAEDEIVIRSRVIPDTSGIYTIYEQLDGSGDVIQRISVPEGKAPYKSNTWATYRAYQMEGDRQAMLNAINYANRQQEIDLVVGTTNAAVHGIEAALTGAAGSSILNLGAPAVAGAAMGASISLLESGLAMWETAKASDLKKLQAVDDVALSRKRAIQQPQTAYNVAYGLIYIIEHNASMPRVEIQMPENMTADYYDGWRDNFGYAAEGVMEISAVEGFYQGKLLNDGTMTGQRFDELNKDFIKGFRFIRAGLPIYDAVLTGTGQDLTYGGVTWKQRQWIDVNGNEYGTRISSNHWIGNGFQGTIMRSDLVNYAGIRWGQATDTIDLDSFGYCRYYYIAGRLFANDDYTGINLYTEITGTTKEAIISHYNPRLYPEDDELTDYMVNYPFHSLSAEE